MKQSALTIQELELAALRKDAERYRWLRSTNREYENEDSDNLGAISGIYVVTSPGISCGAAEAELDAAIDAAMRLA